jgi:hypothetical protein
VLTALARVHAIGDRSLYNLQLDQWTGRTDGSLEDLRNKIDGTKFAAGEDKLGFDLSLQGCRNANLAFAQMGSKSSTYYLSLVTSASREPSIFGVPFPTMNVLLRETAAFQEQRAEFTLAPRSTSDDSKTASRDPAAVRAPHPDIWRLWLPPMPSPGS